MVCKNLRPIQEAEVDLKDLLLGKGHCQEDGSVLPLQKKQDGVSRLISTDLFQKLGLIFYL